MKSNLLYFAPANSVHSFRWIEYFKNKDYNITWVSFHEIQDKFLIDYPGIKIITLTKQHEQIVKGNFFVKLLGFFSAVIKINSIIKENNCQICQVQSLGLYGITVLFIKALPFVGTAWGSDVIFVSNPFKKFLLQLVLKKAKYVTCDADHMLDRLSYLGVDKARLKLIYFGVEVDIYNSHNFPSIKDYNDTFTILSLRNHFDVYDIETIIIGFSEFVRSVPSKLIIAGIGDLTESYENLVKDLNIEKFVEFTGRYNRNDLKCLIGKSDLYISASKSDAGIAASTAECMACELVCLISDSGENSKWIIDGLNGFLFKTSDIKSIVEKLFLAYESRSKFEVIANNGASTIISKNNYINEMAKIDELYKKL